MKLDRIALEEFRRFRAPFALDGLQPGLNLFVGPNEAGKSTIAAALRGAFLQRFKTSKVEDFAPWNSSGARPTVTVQFRVGAREYELRKSFLTKARCELLIDGGAQRLEGEQAEDALAELLGFEFASKGQSKAEHSGVPGLLWIQQGEGQNLLEPAAYAGSHLRDALSQLSGELVTGDSDRVFDRAVEARAALRDARSNRPKGEYKAAEDALAEAMARQSTLLAEKTRLDTDVDQLAQLRDTHEKARQAQPWTELEKQAAQARDKLATIRRDQDAADALKRESLQAAQTLTLLQEQVARDQQDEDEVAALARELEKADQAVTQAQETRQRTETSVAGRTEAANAATALLEAAQAESERRDLSDQIVRAERELGRLETAHREAQVLTQRIAEFDAQVQANHLDSAQLTALRTGSQQLAPLQSRQSAGATRLSFHLDSANTTDVSLDGVSLQGTGERQLSAETLLAIAGIGRFQIAPGGADLPTLRLEIASLQREQTLLLEKLGVADLAAADARAMSGERARRDAQAARKELAIHAPDGLDALLASIQENRARITQLTARAQALPVLAEAPSSLSLPEITAAQREAQTALIHAQKAVTQAQRAFDQVHAQAQLLRSQLDARRSVREQPSNLDARAQRGSRLVLARAARDDLQSRVQAAEAAIAAHQPALIEQDMKRFEQSARIARETHEARHASILQLQGRLDQAGSQGVGENLAQAAADVERLQRRRDEFSRRALALDLLVDLLRTQRDAATQRLQAPLARRLNHYLHLLFPNAALRLDDSLMPTGLQRGDNEDLLRSLSFGTQEQLGVLVRLAYADLLQEAGRPTLLILDDALVHADESRRALMKRALFDAGERHQILIFTCHGEMWQDLAVAPRSLG
ncbi:AAA family ATPase [Pigmentiphaga aceris]|uniref:AAA family ATPase n=2 Tax=Pigmentiphaga aceris TaxID=1940612 RepID=A0A5C0B3X0_9BURK|nr:AAA family ATPase [Pigmentiphaga aceris]QEI09589.1 AAA family ATPase [Pigmentiphaga aceris]